MDSHETVDCVLDVGGTGTHHIMLSTVEHSYTIGSKFAVGQLHFTLLLTLSHLNDCSIAPKPSE